jgi:hypothetical protein
LGGASQGDLLRAHQIIVSGLFTRALTGYIFIDLDQRAVQLLDCP